MLGVDAEKVDLVMCPSVIVALFWVKFLNFWLLSLFSKRLLGLKLSFVLPGISSKSSRKHVFAFLFIPWDQVLLFEVATKLDCIFLHLVSSKEKQNFYNVLNNFLLFQTLSMNECFELINSSIALRVSLPISSWMMPTLRWLLKQNTANAAAACSRTAFSFE